MNVSITRSRRAGHEQTKTFELRAATDVARLWRGIGSPNDPRALLKPILARSRAARPPLTFATPHPAFRAWHTGRLLIAVPAGLVRAERESLSATAGLRARASNTWTGPATRRKRRGAKSQRRNYETRATAHLHHRTLSSSLLPEHDEIRPKSVRRRPLDGEVASIAAFTRHEQPATIKLLL
jgi:hypothetical protein